MFFKLGLIGSALGIMLFHKMSPRTHHTVTICNKINATFVKSKNWLHEPSGRIFFLNLQFFTTWNKIINVIFTFTVICLYMYFVFIDTCKISYFLIVLEFILKCLYNLVRCSNFLIATRKKVPQRIHNCQLCLK